MRLPIAVVLFVVPSALDMHAQTKAVFYMTPEPGSVRSFIAHADKIDIAIPTIYSADEGGAVSGTPEGVVLEMARKYRVPLMPIIVNPGFKQETIHKMLGDPAARARVAKSLVEECRRHGYYGIQLDFENIPASDRGALTALVRETAFALASGGFKLSIATMYQTADSPPEGGYARWLYENWLGAYDLAEISKHVEFVSVMTYDQHTERTPPGPIAGFPWVREVLDYCLRSIPKEKLSLGIPLYGRRWHAGTLNKDAALLTSTVHFHSALELAAQMGVTPQWDGEARTPWFFFYRDGVREYVFYSDVRSFRERYNLARERQLHGFSAWVLGAEDPEIWNDLPPARR